MTARKIIVFLGSTREGRQGAKVADYVKTILEKTGLSAKIFGNRIIYFKSNILTSYCRCQI